jgi:hypothetical protein
VDRFTPSVRGSSLASRISVGCLQISLTFGGVSTVPPFMREFDLLLYADALLSEIGHLRLAEGGFGPRREHTREGGLIGEGGGGGGG